MFIMTLGGFGGIWEEIPNTKHEVIGIKTMLNVKCYDYVNSCIYRQNPLVPLYCSSGDTAFESSHCYDGWHICQSKPQLVSNSNIILKLNT